MHAAGIVAEVVSSDGVWVDELPRPGLFGSRVWKSRSSAVFWIEGETFTVWKQRGYYLEKRWGGAIKIRQHEDVDQFGASRRR